MASREQGAARSHDPIREADEAASVVHDFLWGKNGVTKEQADEAIWIIHNLLRPLYGEQGEAI